MVGRRPRFELARDGRVEVRPILPITATIDHRYADASQLAQALNAFRAYLAAPERFEPPLRSGAQARAVSS